MNAANYPLGDPVPFIEHAISVSLPRWQDVVGYEENSFEVVNKMQTGYPRFFIHKSIQKLAAIIEGKSGITAERAMLFPSFAVAEACRTYLARRSVSAHIVPQTPFSSPTSVTTQIFAVFFHRDSFHVAKLFWQHTGLGISSRFAEHYLRILPSSPAWNKPIETGGLQAVTGSKHYGSKPTRTQVPLLIASPSLTNSHDPPTQSAYEEDFGRDQAVFFEERYGRNLDLSSAAHAKIALRRRIAGMLIAGVESGVDDEVEIANGQDVRGAPVTDDDVYLYPTGMSAIWSSHQLALQTLGERKSVCFGFPYGDTLKVLEKWGPGVYHLGHGTDASVDELETILSTQLSLDPSKPPVLALFTEFPSNPLLRSANLPRLRDLADKYDFLLVIDDTLGNFMNVKVLPFADIVVTSLAKLFSGDANVMGGSLVLNPSRKHYIALKAQLTSSYEDTYFDEDAIFMERNSRNFAKRVPLVDENAAAVCEYLHSAVSSTSAITEVFYPKYMTSSNYEACRVRPSAGYGGLFSVSFASLHASRAFFDNLQCYKGPSLGTNFTLACPFTILVHYVELDWAASWGVPEGLVRVSVGLEDRDHLMKIFRDALEAAEQAHREYLLLSTATAT